MPELSSLGYFDPFCHVPEEQRVNSFTEQLQEKDEQLQWAMPCALNAAATQPTRGNMAIAKQVSRLL